MIGIADGRSSATAEPAGAPMDDFDISELRIEPGADLIPTQKVLTVVPIRKPRKTEFVRVCPDPKPACDACFTSTGMTAKLRSSSCLLSSAPFPHRKL